MLAITCFSFPLTDWTDGLDLLSRGGEPDITGSKTISNEVQEVRLDVCLTALLLLPLLFIPNIIEKELEEVRKESAPDPNVLSHYTVTPLPPTQPTPQTFWRPHHPLPHQTSHPLSHTQHHLSQTPHHPLDHQTSHPLPNTQHQSSQTPDNPLPHTQHQTSFPTVAAVPSVTTPRPTTPRPTTPRPTTATSISTTEYGEVFSLADSDTSGDYDTELWVDVPKEPELANNSAEALRREVQTLREHYLRMGVPQDYLTDHMIWKLMQARGQTEKGFHF